MITRSHFMFEKGMWHDNKPNRKENQEDKCPKISNTKASDKMAYANSADPDQTAPEV